MTTGGFQALYFHSPLALTLAPCKAPCLAGFAFPPPHHARRRRFPPVFVIFRPLAAWAAAAWTAKPLSRIESARTEWVDLPAGLVQGCRTAGPLAFSPHVYLQSHLWNLRGRLSAGVEGSCQKSCSPKTTST